MLPTANHNHLGQVGIVGPVKKAGLGWADEEGWDSWSDERAGQVGPRSGWTDEVGLQKSQPMYMSL